MNVAAGFEKAFLKAMAPIAQALERDTQIRPIIAMVQSAHESRWGMSDLTLRANNLFGFTAGDAWLKDKKPVVEMATREESKYPPAKIKYWNRPGDVLEAYPNGRGGSVLKVVVAFRAYESWDASLRDWANHILTFSKYALAVPFAKAGDVAGYAKAISEAKYATDTNYEAKLLAMHRRVTEAMA